MILPKFLRDRIRKRAPGPIAAARPAGVPADFDPSAYLALNPDVAQAAIDPREHYLLFGADEGRRFSRQELEDLLAQAPADFDAESYLRLNPDLRESCADPLVHYVETGRREGRSYKAAEPKLPGFDPQTYLELNPDVRAAGVDPLLHYLTSGFREGRAIRRPQLVQLGEGHAKGAGTTILVVTHEASRSGAPLLALDMVRRLAQNHEVVVLLLGTGPILGDFVESGSATWLLEGVRGLSDDTAASLAVQDLCTRYEFACALVNSIESRPVLRALHGSGVATTTLVHEFSAYIRPSTALPAALFWSTRAVLPARILLEGVLKRPDLEDARHLHVLAQGYIEVRAPGTTRSPAWVRKNPDSVLIVGIGSVVYRKGVDLFIDCARRIRSSAPDLACEFVWVGGGYAPERDVEYSAFIADQIDRSGLSDVFRMQGETGDLRQVYEEADLLLLTSRLDPYPNVALDACAAALPVLCFRDATGFVDLIEQCGLGPELVADYLDSADLAAKVVALAHSPGRRRELGLHLQERAQPALSMATYVARLQNLLAECRSTMAQERADALLIADAGVLDPGHSTHPALVQAGVEARTDQRARAYVRGWSTGIFRRKPFPGFHPGVYAEMNSEVANDPLAHYLASGRPRGPWECRVITPAQQVSLQPAPAAALHIHVYYPDLLNEILDRLSLNASTPDLFLTVTCDDHRLVVERALRGRHSSSFRIIAVDNRGRDIGPFFDLLRSGQLDAYAIVGHLHTKKSVGVDAASGSAWFTFLLEHLVGGGSGAMADRCLSALSEDAQLQMIIPDDPYVSENQANRQWLNALCARLQWAEPPRHFPYPVGSMFWARRATLLPLLDLELGSRDWPQEPLPSDGTVLHALERLLGLTAWRRPGSLATTHVAGVTR